MYNTISKLEGFVLVLIGVLVFWCGTNSVSAQESPSVLYVPLIGITSIPEPSALPEEGGNITYHYAVKNFLREVALRGIEVVDDTCSPVTFAEGDDNNNAELEYSETWRYVCTAQLSTTTQSTATARGTANTITATHRAYTTVIVGSDTPAPLVSIVNVTKVAYPLSLPPEGGSITFTYKVNNPGVVPLSYVTVTDNKCSAMSGKLGDTNGNDLLDTDEVWIYTCTITLDQTTTNTATVRAFAGGFEAVAEATITVEVDTPDFPEAGVVPGFPTLSLPGFPGQEAPGLPEGGTSPAFKSAVWGTLSGFLAALIAFFILTRKSKMDKKR